MPPEAPDSAEADALRDLLRSPGYALVAERIQAMIETERTALERPCDAEKTAVMRGTVYALRTALLIPQILIEEIKASGKE